MELKYKCASLDTNVLIRLIIRDNEEQHKCALNLVLNGKDYYVDDYVVMEAVYVLTKEKYTRKDIVDSLRLLLDSDIFIYNKKFFTPVFERYLSHPSLSFNDCVIEAKVNEKYALPLWTFDHKFAQQSSTAKLLSPSGTIS